MGAFPGSSRLWLQAMEAASVVGRRETLTLGGVLNELADVHGASPALIDDEETVSYRDLAQRANRYANWARAEGFAPGATIALLMRNCADYVAIWAGLSQAGCVVALINTNLTNTALTHAIHVAEASAIIVETALVSEVIAIAPEISTLKFWRHGAGEGIWPRVDLAVAAESGLPPSEVQTRNAPALLIYTSGTTGLPKAANISHARVLQWSYWFAGLMDTQPTDRLYNCLPMYHSTGGVSAIGAMLVRGGSVYIRRRFSATRFWPEVVASGATIFQYIGELCRYLLRAFPHAAEAEHKLRLCCGNGLREEVWREFESRFHIPRIIEFYAMTEGAVSLFNCEGRPGAIGHVPGFLARSFPLAIVQCDTDTKSLVRGEDGRCLLCKPGEVGEALGRLYTKDGVSSARFEGYTDTRLTQTKLARGVFQDDDIWYRSGDLMRRDKDGFYYFVDRLGDSFRWKGENVSASEVAAVISSFHGVEDAVVFGVNIPENEGRAGMAVIAAGPDFDLADLRRHIYKNLPPYARPIFLRLRKFIERTGTFKLSAALVQAEGYREAALEELHFDDRNAQTYIPVTDELRLAIQRGAVFL